jgi:hypothetical protein
VYTSDPTSNWNYSYVDSGAEMKAVVFTGGLWVVVDENGYVISCADPSVRNNWRYENNGNRVVEEGQALAYTNGITVVVGNSWYNTTIASNIGL